MALCHSGHARNTPQVGRSVSGFHCTHGHSCDGDLERVHAKPVPVSRSTIGILLHFADIQNKYNDHERPIVIMGAALARSGIGRTYPMYH